MINAITLLAGTLLSIFVLITGLGGKEINDTTHQLQPLKIDLLMPPNERVYSYFKEYSPKYDIPMNYILRCARLESSYKGPGHVDYAPFEDWLVSSALAYSVLQVRVVASRDAWPEHNYVKKQSYFPAQIFTEDWFKEKKAQFKYCLRYGLAPTTVLEYKTDEELAYLLRYNLRFNIESGIRYMRFLRNMGYTWTQVYSVYNQGWAGAHNINSYARYITHG